MMKLRASLRYVREGNNRMKKSLFAVTALGVFVSLPAGAQRSPRWFATWAPSNFAAPAPLPDSVDRVPTYFDQTLRQIVHITLGGAKIRIRISNEYGERPLVIGAAHVAIRDSAAAIRMPTDRAVTFGGSGAVTLRPGAVVTSDAISLSVASEIDLSISLWVRDSIRGTTRHPGAHQTSYLSGSGDQTGAGTFAPAKTFTQWYWLAGVDVLNSAATGVIVAFGNSITDGNGSTLDANARWPDQLARRLLSRRVPPKAVVNAGISGNRVLSPTSGPSALARFDRDVLLEPGVTHIVLLEGINDLLHSNAPPETRDSVTAADIIFGYKQLISRAHDHGLIIYGATLTPIGGLNRATALAADAKRRVINEWIRTSGAFDGVIDFDLVTRDPTNPDRFLPAYDSGDHLHPNDAGYKAMGESIKLSLFNRAQAR
jgi:lysophospholipase L1-like esterase